MISPKRISEVLSTGSNARFDYFIVDLLKRACDLDKARRNLPPPARNSAFNNHIHSTGPIHPCAQVEQQVASHLLSASDSAAVSLPRTRSEHRKLTQAN